MFQITQYKYRVAIIKKNSIEVKNDLTDIAGGYDWSVILVLYGNIELFYIMIRLAVHSRCIN